MTVTPDWSRRLGRLGNRNVRVIYNGFDQSDCVTQTSENKYDSTIFSITYIGVLMEVRNPEKLWQAFGELVKEDESFGSSLRINIIGQIDNSVRRSIAECGLTKNVSLRPYVPHDEVAVINRDSTLLLLTLNPEDKPMSKGLVPAKLFEYLASGQPILCIGPEDGDAAQILRETSAGTTVGFGDKEKMKAEIMQLYELHKTGGIPTRHDKAVEKYSRRALAGEYAALLDKVR